MIEDNKNTYLALTIGPIYKTINASQRTRMLWGASFLFSYLIRELAKLLKTGILNDDEHLDCIIAGRILIPFVGDDKTKIEERIENDKCIAGEGKYPDRILIHSEEGDFEKMQKAIGYLIQFLGDDIARHLKIESEAGKKRIIEDLTDYLQFYFIEKEIGKDENALLSLYSDLDVLELRSNYLANDSNYYLFYYLFFLSIKSNKQYSLLAENAFPVKEDRRFKSLIEISTAGFKNTIDKDQYKNLVTDLFIKNQLPDVPRINPAKEYFKERFNDDDDKQDEFIRILKSGKDKDNKSLFSTQFKKFHQYFAVIYADGDNIGTTLREIGSKDTKIEDFSKMLLDFNGVVVNLINNYGGAPVYIGGEDIFAFVPLASIENGNRVTIFNLINDIDKAFGTYFTKEYAEELGVVRPTLSFGVAIAYYKNPLGETMGMAHKLLGKAKGVDGKNAIELILEEHSGQQFQMSVPKGKEVSYKTICALMELLTTKVFSKEKEDKQEKEFINSITHKLKDPLFKALLLAVANDPLRLDEFFKNSFNEPIHKGDMKGYIEEIKKLITAIFSDYRDDDETCINNLYSTLRLIDFLHKNPKDE
jgi:CRISPR-associated protein Cmr2